MTPPDLRARLEPVLALLAKEPASLSSVREPERAWRVHVEDSLSGLELVGRPRRLADLGSGAGFPGLALAAALPATRVDLIESVRRKCGFIERAIAVAALANARAVHARAEDWAREPDPAGGREAYDVVTARAVGRLVVLAELTSPLLRRDASLVAWKGRRDAAEEAELERAGPALAMELQAVHRVPPAPGAEHRHLVVVRKLGSTPPSLPRRPGLAAKRPPVAGKAPPGRRGPG